MALTIKCLKLTHYIDPATGNVARTEVETCLGSSESGTMSDDRGVEGFIMESGDQTAANVLAAKVLTAKKTEYGVS